MATRKKQSWIGMGIIGLVMGALFLWLSAGSEGPTKCDDKVMHEGDTCIQGGHWRSLQEQRDADSGTIQGVSSRRLIQFL
ncbi:hypothetical protein [Streptomyces sp. NBC_00212]|uniref:hypothetical protein n=1 Tax=Streptomyces sp. NBC_00212 TaxID=2975684 RepID=UPI002F91136B